MQLLSLLALAAPLVSAIQFTSPAPGSSFDRGSTVTVTWTSVDTDPSVFSLYLWNFAFFPPFYQQLASNVNTTSGKFSVRVPCNVAAESGYQFTAINGTNVYIIYAQTALQAGTNSTFSLGGPSCNDVSTTTQGVPTTVTVTACGSSATQATTKTLTTNSTRVATATGGLTTTAKPTTVTVNAGSAASFAWTTVFVGFAAVLFASI